MNKYIYKVRFVTLNFLYTTRTKIMHKHEVIFGNQQTVSTTEKIDYKRILSLRCFMSILTKISVLNFRSLKEMILQQTPSSDTPTSGTHPPHFFFYLECRLALEK